VRVYNYLLYHVWIQQQNHKNYKISQKYDNSCVAVQPCVVKYDLIVIESKRCKKTRDMEAE
jgi:hypothetical protein